MRADSIPRGWVLLSCAAVLATGCAARTPLSLSDEAWAQAPRAPEDSWGATNGGLQDEASPTEDSIAPGRLRRRRTPTQVQGSAVVEPSSARETIAEDSTQAGPPLPPGWPELDSSEEVLAPFQACASPADFIALQRSVDMPRLLEGLKDWDAVRLGALGPLLHADAAEVLHRKRASFLVTTTEQYGPELAEVFALFILHSAFDDDLRSLLTLLARDKQLSETLGTMGAVREELRRRGLDLAEYPDRSERAGDALRGLGRAARDALATIPLVSEPRYTDYAAKRAQLPPPYQEALHELERTLMARHFAPGNVALGSFDALTFGVPMGFYHLATSTSQGAASLARGRYEQATRELAPAALMVALYAGGKGQHPTGPSRGAVRRLQLPAVELDGLKAVVDRLGARLGMDAVPELLRYIQASREAGLLVAEGGEAAAVALHQTRGNVPRAWQAVLAEANSPGTKPGSARTGLQKSGGSVAAAVREAAGFEQEALATRWLQVEAEASGPRLPRDVRWLEEQRPSLDAPPPGVPEGSARWGEYVTYRQQRLSALKKGEPVEGPLRWEAYETVRGLFARGLDFERTMANLLRADAALPQAQRRWLKGFIQPRIETHVGVAKADAPGVRYADVLVIEEKPPANTVPRAETFSFKSRNFKPMDLEGMRAQLTADAEAAMTYYGGTLNIRRRNLGLTDVEVRVQRVRLIYEGGALKHSDAAVQRGALTAVKGAVTEVEVSFQ
ncbi:hypothetical protein ACLESO_16675 [Pyxidicoccus sp. 3LG]